VYLFWMLEALEGDFKVQLVILRVVAQPFEMALLLFRKRLVGTGLEKLILLFAEF